MDLCVDMVIHMHTHICLKLSPENKHKSLFFDRCKDWYVVIDLEHKLAFPTEITSAGPVFGYWHLVRRDEESFRC